MPVYGEDPPRYLISVDLGIAQERTALSVMELHGARPAVELHVRALSRPPIGTKTAAIIDEVREVCDRLGEQLVRRYGRWVTPETLRRSCRTVLVDLTGSGLPALALFTRAGVSPVPIWLTNGQGSTHEAGGYRVAKVDLISALALLVEDGRLKVAAGLPDAPAVLAEFQRYGRKTPLGTHEDLALWREQPSDDIVLSFAMGAWYAQQGADIRMLRVFGV